MTDGDANAHGDTIDARPTKGFFVRMLVRDIELVPAIVDLVDNSVDGAKRLASAAINREGAAEKGGQDGNGEGPVDEVERLTHAMAGHEIRVTVGPDRFSIVDDCGGIELDDALRYVFRFGRLEDVEPVEGEVGQFGVGMKRALFKLGTHFVVEATAAASHFRLDVDVDDWLAEPDVWTFPLAESTRDRHDAGLGTSVSVDRLLPSVAAEFGEERFLARLRDEIEFRHQAVIAAGLTIKLNNTPLRSRPLALLAGEGLTPRVVVKNLTADGETVHLRLYAGFVDVNEEQDTDDPDQFTGVSRAGWYIVCNDRMLLFADKTRLTGWGQEVADYHPQYRRFRGYAFLSGPSSAMPWNTAKTAIDQDSPVWHLVRAEIVDALRDARSIMNRLKTERQERPEAERPVSRELGAAQPTALADLAPSPAITVPPRPPRQPPSVRRIAYSVATEEFDEVTDVLGEEAASEVGRRTFDYFYRREVDG